MPLVESSIADLAGSPKVASCLDWFLRSRGWINQKHLELCRIAAPTFFEQERAEWMVAQFSELGWDARLDASGNAIATLPDRRRDAPAVAVTAHLDTVLAPRSPKDVWVGDQGRFFGPGVSDNGVGLAALLALAAAWQEHPPLEESPLAPMLIANVGEEGEGNLSGMRFLCQEPDRHPEAFLILDGPSVGHITNQALASRRYEIHVTGPGGHSWNDRGRPNPLHALSRVILNFADRFREDCHDLASESEQESAYNFGVLQGGTSINAIPAEAWVKVDLRSLHPSGMDQLGDLLAEVVADAVQKENSAAVAPANLPGNKRPLLQAHLKEIGSRPGGKITPGAPILEAITAVDAYLGIRSRLDCSSTDANIPLSLGIPAISIGAGGRGGGAHTTSEWYHPQGREQGLQRLLLTLCLLLRQPSL